MSKGIALVTGASSGIGRVFAERLAADGFDLIMVGRREDRLIGLAESLPQAARVVVADLATDAGIDQVAQVCADQPIAMLVNNAGLAHYMPLADLTVAEAREVLQVKTLAPALLTRAVIPGMLSRGTGRIVNVAGMLAFSGPAPAAAPPSQRALYVGTLAGLVALTQTLHAELAGTGVDAHVVCPGIVATEFHTVQGMDLSALPRMSPEDVVTATLAGIRLGETVIAPGIEDDDLLRAVFDADLAAFAGQSPTLATRYTSTPNV